MMNKQKGNMYGFVTHTWNAIKGECPHDCEYCYMKVFPQGKLRFDEKELKTDLGENNFIFVGSSIDMFAEVIPEEWIKRVLAKCLVDNRNTYLFQTKNPDRFNDFDEFFNENTILGITLETNRENNLRKCPKRETRACEMEYFSGNYKHLNKFKVMVTIEPIMDFDLKEFVDWIKETEPNFVNIGADSKGHNLPEPSAEKIKELIKELRKFTKVNIKDNLARLCPHYRSESLIDINREADASPNFPQDNKDNRKEENFG